MTETNRFDDIKKIICAGEKIPFQSLINKNRKKEIVYARQLIMYFSRILKVGSLSFIGNKFHKDHSTVLHAIKVIKNYIDTDREKRNRIELYFKKINDIERAEELKRQMLAMTKPLEREILRLEQRLINVQLLVKNLINEIKES